MRRTEKDEIVHGVQACRGLGWLIPRTSWIETADVRNLPKYLARISRGNRSPAVWEVTAIMRESKERLYSCDRVATFRQLLLPPVVLPVFSIDLFSATQRGQKPTSSWK